MSGVNIKRAVENIRTGTTAYTPLVEVIVNALQAIDERGVRGEVVVKLIRDDQQQLDGGLPEVVGFEISDNGVGFTEAHRDSFDTLYTDAKLDLGGKGFGRFTCLKYFDDVRVSSHYYENDTLKKRSFKMGKHNDIVTNEKFEDPDSAEPGTVVSLGPVKRAGAFDKKLTTIARNLVECLLPYFISERYQCPEIVLTEHDASNRTVLNDFLRKDRTGAIREVGKESTVELKSSVGTETFSIRVFKFYNPRNQVSRVSLVANLREVSGSPLHKYVPEFADEFYEPASGSSAEGRNYIVKAYVSGLYLDKHVSVERGGFEFPIENDLLVGIGQSAIERRAAEVAREALSEQVTTRQEKKKMRVQQYVDELAPWHKELLAVVDLSDLSLNPSSEEIEARLQREKFVRDQQLGRDVAKVLAIGDLSTVQEDVNQIVSRISGTSKNELVHYVALRKKILDLFEKSLQTDDAGKYSSEGTVHDIIFPRRKDSESTPFSSHNLWILDERLNFTSYVSSDIPLDGGTSDRSDLIAYGRRVLFRGDNEPSNPVTVFEFKKPQRDDFVDASSKEDPVQQIIRYVNRIRDGHYKTPEGRRMQVADNTPFYGFVVCDLTPKVERWLEKEKEFKPMPDRLGWFQWRDNINLYVEVVSWDKVLKDARMRSKVFFQKLGI